MAQTAEGGMRAEVFEPSVGVPIGRRLLTLSDRTCWTALGIAMGLAAALILWLNRDTTYSIDQYDFVEASPGLAFENLFEPHNGHLVLTTRLAYKGLLETGGIDYLQFRVLGVLALLLAVGCFFALAKRWVPAPVALAPSVLLLFLGSAWHHVIVPVGYTNLLSIALGLAALLAIERGERRGDVAACALLTLSAATFSTGLAFLAAVAVTVALRRQLRTRAWVFLVPLVLYVVWLVLAPTQEGGAEPETEASNLLLIPAYVTESLMTVLAAITGLNYDFADPTAPGSLYLGGALAVLALIALGLRLARGDVPARLWVALAAVLAYWSLLALSVDVVRPPGALRYTFMGAVGVLLVAAAAVGRARWSERGILALYAVTALSLATNVALMGEGAERFREYSAQAQAQFTALELARAEVDPGFDPNVGAATAAVSSPAGTYFTLADRYGSPAFTVDELEEQEEPVRQLADQVLAAALGLRLEPAGGDASPHGCRTVRAQAPGQPIPLELSSPGATLTSPEPAEATVTADRFADEPSAELGTIASGATTTLVIPPDGLDRPWSVEVSATPSIEVCALR